MGISARFKYTYDFDKLSALRISDTARRNALGLPLIDYSNHPECKYAHFYATEDDLDFAIDVPGNLYHVPGIFPLQDENEVPRSFSLTSGAFAFCHITIMNVGAELAYQDSTCQTEKFDEDFDKDSGKDSNKDSDGDSEEDSNWDFAGETDEETEKFQQPELVPEEMYVGSNDGSAAVGEN
jgi:hypothetical protein